MSKTLNIEQAYLQIDYKRDLSLLDKRGELAEKLEPLFPDEYQLDIVEEGLIYSAIGKKLRQFKLGSSKLWFNFEKDVTLAQIYENSNSVIRLLEENKVFNDKVQRIGLRCSYVVNKGLVNDATLFAYKDIPVNAIVSTSDVTFGKTKLNLRFELVIAQHKDSGEKGLLVDCDCSVVSEPNAVKSLRKLYDFYLNGFKAEFEKVVKVIED